MIAPVGAAKWRRNGMASPILRFFEITATLGVLACSFKLD